MKYIAVITGASSGFGALTARALALAGHTVYATMRETAGRNAAQVKANADFAAGLQRGLRRGPVEEVTIEEFARGRPIQLLPAACATFHSHEVVQRARSRVGENEWRLMTNNCEHFCEWCVRGEARSYQAEALLALPGRMAREVRSRLRSIARRRLNDSAALTGTGPRTSGPSPMQCP